MKNIFQWLAQLDKNVFRLLKLDFNIFLAELTNAQQNKAYLLWLQHWESLDVYHVPLIPSRLQQKALQTTIDVDISAFRLHDQGYDISALDTSIKSYRQRNSIQKLLLKQMKSASTIQNILWKQHLYFILEYATMSRPSPENLLYDTSHVSWITDSIKYIEDFVDEVDREDAMISLYSQVGAYLKSHDQTLDEVLETMPSEWLIAAAWDGAVKTVS